MGMLTTTADASPVPDAQPRRRFRAARALAVRWLAGAAWVAVTLYAVALLASHLWRFDLRDPRTPVVLGGWAAFALRTLGLHAALALLVLAVPAAAARRWRLAGACLTVALTSALPILRDLPAAQRPAPTTPAAAATRVVAANLWRHNHHTAPLIEEIAAADPDIIVFTEYAPHWNFAAAARLKDRYPHRLAAVRSDSFGLAIYSRVPVLEHDNFELRLGGAATPQSRTVVEIEGRRVALYALHLATPTHPRMFRQQRAQVADLLDRLDSEVLPVMLVGDFNFTNNSLQADVLHARGFRDGLSLGGAGLATTWPNVTRLRGLPGFRIDHVYLSPALTATSAAVGRGLGSDHRPVVVDVRFGRRQ